MEIRLPWALLGFSDPSSLKLYEAQPNGDVVTVDARRIGIAVAAGDDPLLMTSGYAWEPWQRVSWHERPKAGFDELGATMRELSEARLEQ